MCVETHHRYLCSIDHTEFIGPESKCFLALVPHGKTKMIRGTIPRICGKCLASKGVYVVTRPAAYNVPVTYVPTPAQVIQVPTYVIPAVQPAAIVLPPAPRRAPTLPQQTPGPGSGGKPLNVPAGMIVEMKQEWMKSKGCYEWVAHYKKDPAAPATNTTKQGYNIFHGQDPGPPPPGWGAQPNPFPAPAKTGYNTTYGRDIGPPPPGMVGGAPNLVLPPESLPPAAQPQPQPQPQTQLQAQSPTRQLVRFADPVAAPVGVPIANSDTSETLTETSTETSGSDTETSTTRSSTSSATI